MRSFPFPFSFHVPFAAVLVFLALFAFAGVAAADSPVTSTPFHEAYLDRPAVRAAQASGELTAELAQHLASRKVPLDEKAAIANALGWSFEGKVNAVHYAGLVLRKDAAKVKAKDLGADDAFVFGYLLLLDDYFRPKRALPFLERAQKLRPDSYTAELVLRLARAQAGMDDDWCRVEGEAEALHQSRRKPDLRPAAREIVLEYLDLYYGSCRPELPESP